MKVQSNKIQLSVLVAILTLVICVSIFLLFKKKDTSLEDMLSLEKELNEMYQARIDSLKLENKKEIAKLQEKIDEVTLKGLEEYDRFKKEKAQLDWKIRKMKEREYERNNYRDSTLSSIVGKLSK